MTAGVPQGSVLGPMLWIVMYNGVLHVSMAECLKTFEYADNLVVLVRARALQDVVAATNDAVSRIKACMAAAGLQLAPQKTEVVLVSLRRRLEQIDLQVGDAIVRTQRAMVYLGVTVDARISFQRHRACHFRQGLRGTARFMPNVGGPRQVTRKLLAAVVTSVLLYGVSTWAPALRIGVRRAVITRAYRAEALSVITGIPLIDLLAVERRKRYEAVRTGTPRTACDLRAELCVEWQRRWDAASVGRWTWRFIPDVKVWAERKSGGVDYFITQLLSSHGGFPAYLARMKIVESPLFLHCTDGAVEDAEHVLSVCPRFHAERHRMEAVLGTSTPEGIGRALADDWRKWDVFSSFAAAVGKRIQVEEWQRDAANGG